MRNRKPVKITGYAQAHNLFMTLLSLWMAVETVVQARKSLQPPSTKLKALAARAQPLLSVYIYQGCLIASVN